jgi:hypothetical protein
MPACLALSVLWLLPLLVIDLGGEFAVSDEWAYVQTTRNLLENGTFERSGWTWAPIVSNVAIGWVFSSLFGSCVETLRASGVFLGWVGIMGVYALCRQLGAGRAWSAFGAFLVAFNPLYLALSYTYMTDVPFAAFTTWSLVFWARGLPGPAWKPLAAAALLVAVAVLSRQPGMALAISAVAVAVGTHPRSWRVFALAACGAALLAALWSALPRIFFGEGDAGAFATVDYYLRWMLFSPHAHYHFVRNSITNFLYLGVFLTPLALVSAARLPRRALLAASAAGVVLAISGLRALELSMPSGLDWIYDFGIGPTTPLDEAHLPKLPRAAWWAVAGVGAVGGAAAGLRIALELWDRRRSREWASWLMLVFFPVVYLGVLQVRTPFFDRYLLAVLPPAAAMLVASLHRTAGKGRPLALAVLIALPLAYYGVGGTHDYLQHHRARWELLGALVDGGVSPRRIDGGPAWNGWFNYDPDRSKFKRKPGHRWVYDDEFQASVADAIPGYRPVASREYRRLVPPGVGRVTVFQRANDPPWGLDPAAARTDGAP